ncbi:hypothetical protein [Streptomyces erythrochromogenes]|uniref:hypothetical protein n=1 Tax=Streptomyces erythrochromogenes TaxID=285574 RepID=UPI0004CCB5B1|nr:hypothetical protein [Streptomyces erythrochromogenes]
MQISEMFHLVRGNQHILDVLDILHRDRLAPRIHDFAFSARGLRHPRTGELPRGAHLRQATPEALPVRERCTCSV